MSLESQNTEIYNYFKTGLRTHYLVFFCKPASRNYIKKPVFKKPQ
jgi:hypothetical protein